MTINFPNNPGYGEGETSSYTYSSDGIVQSWYWGETGYNPVEAWIPNYSGTIGGGGIGSQGNQGFQGPPGDGEGGGNPQGPEGSVQFADSNSLSGIAEVGVFSNNSLNPSKGLSANFLHYTESLSADENAISSNTNKDISFGTYNTYRIPNIRLDENRTFTIQGLSPITGASLTLILGHTGASGSKIEFSENMGIYWANGGPSLGDIGGGTAYIYPTATKKYDIIYFFSDGTEIFGNHQRNYRITV